MKKKLLMAAVGAALVAGPMLASAAGTTVYGRLHMSLDQLDNDADVTQGYIASNSSRFGIKGDEDLGTGLKAIYQVEQSFSADEGTGGTLASRNTFLGMAGDWGTAKIGRNDTPYKDLGARFNRFIEQVGDARNMYGTGSICNFGAATATSSAAYTACDSRAGFDARADNMLRYDSPTFGGAKVSVLYSNNTADSATPSGTTGAAGSGDDSGTTGRSLASMTASWSTGPMFLGLGYEQHDKLKGVASTLDPTVVRDSDSESGIRFVGDYTFNDFTVGLFYEMVSDFDGISGLDRDVMGLMAAYKMGNNTFKAHWLDSGDLDCPSGADCSGTDTSMMAIGVDHAFSKTTMVYLDYAMAEAGDNTIVDVANGYTGHGEQNTPVRLGKTTSGISLGMMVNF